MYSDHEPAIDEDDGQRRCSVEGCGLLSYEHETDPLWGLDAEDNRVLREALSTRVDKLDGLVHEDLPSAAATVIREDRERLNHMWGRLEDSPVGRATSAPLSQREEF